MSDKMTNDMMELKSNKTEVLEKGKNIKSSILQKAICGQNTKYATPEKPN